jgi:hypothetical protein
MTQDFPTNSLQFCDEIDFVLRLHLFPPTSRSWSLSGLSFFYLFFRFFTHFTLCSSRVLWVLESRLKKKTLVLRLQFFSFLWNSLLLARLLIRNQYFKREQHSIRETLKSEECESSTRELKALQWNEKKTFIDRGSRFLLAWSSLQWRFKLWS